jgi:D-threo-aldose 1-dehydrogenase
MKIPPLGYGAAPIGNLYRAVSDEQAAETVAAAWDCGIRYFDTAPHYGIGLAEKRLGAALSGHDRSEYVLSTKVGRVLVPHDPAPGETDIANGFDVPAVSKRVWDFSADGVNRSIEASLTRLGLDRIDIVLIHDPDESPVPSQGLDLAYPALDALRRQGVVGAIGVGSKDPVILEQFATQSDVDVLMIAGRYTLLEQPALDTILPACTDRGIGILNVGIFNSGLLAVAQPGESQTYEYGAAPSAILQRAQAIAAACERHGVTLPQAAVAFASTHPAVVSVVIGASKPSHVISGAEWFAAPPPPAALWTELTSLGLLRPDAPVPAA